MSEKRYLWGIDLGGTKIEGIIFNAEDHHDILIRTRVDIEASKGYDHIIDQIGVLIDKMTTQSGRSPNTIGMGTPGTVDPIDNLHKNSNTTCINGKPFHADLEDRLSITFKMANDANCFAIAEAILGEAAHLDFDPKVVFGVIMGTGVGGGLVVDRQIIGGRQGIGGEWGHMYLDQSGGNCYCGKVGCTETIISGTGVQKWYALKSGQHRSLKEIVNRYREDSDIVARDAMHRLFHFFGKGIAQVINILDPDVVVLGGGLSNIEELYTIGVEEVKKHIFNQRLDTRILKPKLGDSAGVFGAALLTKDQSM